MAAPSPLSPGSASAGVDPRLGLFDTVSAIGLTPNSVKSGEPGLMLPSGIAENIFHITAANECRYNFPLNSLKPFWPELSLPGTHSDIGGGYFPLESENIFLSRPLTEAISDERSDLKVEIFRKVEQQMSLLLLSKEMEPLLRANHVVSETWFDERYFPDQYGQMQKRVFVALTMRRPLIKNS